MGLIRIDQTGNKIPCEKFKGFIKNGSTVYFTDFVVYVDGIIDCWGEVNIEGFKQKIKEGWVYLNPKEGDEIRVGDIGGTEFKVVVKSIIVFDNDTEEKMLNTVCSIIDRLNGIDRAKMCVDAYYSWMKDKTEQNRKTLEECYLKVPEQRRMFLLGDMDHKDIPIRIAIYGNDEIRTHTHFAVSNALIKSKILDDLNIDSSTMDSIKSMSDIFENPEKLD